MVAINEDRKRTAVPKFNPESPDEIRRYEAAIFRREMKKSWKKNLIMSAYRKTNLHKDLFGSKAIIEHSVTRHRKNLFHLEQTISDPLSIYLSIYQRMKTEDIGVICPACGNGNDW